jgi:hypothetical protein
MTYDELEVLAEEVLEKTAASAGQQGEEGHKLWQANQARRSAEEEIADLPRGLHHGRESSIGPSKPKTVMDRIKDVGSKAKGRAKELGAKAKHHAGRAVEVVKKHPKSFGAGAVGLAAAGYGAHRLSKQSSALDTLVLLRAEEILAENGIGTAEQE